MLMGKRVVAVLPAYRAEKTLEVTYRDLPHDIIDTVLLVDDASPDRTAETARRLGIKTFIHRQNRGYGGNQKTCYREALTDGAGIAIMVRPGVCRPRIFSGEVSFRLQPDTNAVLAKR